MERYARVRAATLALCDGLEPEDTVVQSMPDVSPTKWHLAHTSWFFETFVLAPRLDGYRSPDPQYAFLFNSYYNSVGAMHRRVHRGLLSRPTLAEVIAYRRHVDDHVERLLGRTTSDEALASLIVLGLNFLFAGQPARCVLALDVDASGVLEITDSIRILNYLFRSGPAPEAPFPGCGTAQNQAALPCEGAGCAP